MTEIEKKAALTLRPYFSKDPIVFDIGSNKGDWADVLVRSCYNMHLFEPNEILLHYSMVRFDTLTHIAYFNFGIGSRSIEADFYYFINQNNGLSSIYYNPYYVDELKLPMQKCEIKVKALDDWWPKKDQIDMIKIDVEGADFDVLLGAKNILSERRVKFIQIEYSKHYELAGYTFENVVDFVRQFGYDVFHFNGESFEKRTDQQAENFYIMDKDFTQDWNREFKANTKALPKVMMALEIGCFEGLTTNYICDNLLQDGGRMICVDPLTDEYLPGHKDNEMFKGQYERFIRNTSGYPVELVRKKSKDAFQDLKDYRFGLIYIDGDHTQDGVFTDAVQYWNVLREDGTGYMLFDDYGQSEDTAAGIDRFLETQKGNFELITKGYQVLIRRKW